VEEYHKVRAYLNQQIRRGGDRELLQIAKLAMMLAFRTGMRRREAFGLRLDDLPDIRHLDIIVQPHEERRLKSDASRRIITARFLLPLPERRELQAWLRRRFDGADMKDESAWVFDVPTPQGGWRRLSAERTADRIIEALSRATGQPTKIHQLRHSFGTWMYLAMRAPDYPEVLPLFDHLPLTQALLKRGSRLRQLLLNHPGPTSRAYGYVAARLLGHSSPLVSLNGYIHSTEFIHRALAIRTADQLPAGTLRGVANLKPAWGNRLRESGVEHLFSQVRAEHARKELAELKPSTQAPVNTECQTPATTPTQPLRRGRPKKLSPHNWIDLMKVHELLHTYSSTLQTMDEICEQLDLKPETGRRIVAQVQTTGKGLGFNERGTRPLAFPEFARKQSEWKLIKPLEQRLQRAFALDPNASSARCIAPPVLAKALSYRDWVGLQIVTGDGEAWPSVTRGVMFLAYVACS
jgi:integrase